jgi:hypothetical protein
MAKNRTTYEVIPSASRLIQSLRDVGYDFVHAVADLVDNSIAASASKIAIEMRFDGPASWIRIADNGNGMSASTINEAMRFGSEQTYDIDDLGKFGLGLKTASLSQCACFTVASRIDPDARRIEVRQWDLNHVKDTNRWEIFNIPVDERPKYLTECLQDTTGTVVLWECLDRFMGYKLPWGERARNGFFRIAELLDQHLAMVFHRFISGEAKRKKKLTISINGTVIEPWDPFARDEKATIKFNDDQFEISTDECRGLVGYQAFILPNKESFSSLKAFERYSGPGKWNYQQGLYIYRADRMIQSGGWCRMRTSDEHTKLARVALDFHPDLDAAFELSVSKAKVNLPESLKWKLHSQIESLAKQAKVVYSSSSRNKPATSGFTLTTSQPSNPQDIQPTKISTAIQVSSPISEPSLVPVNSSQSSSITAANGESEAEQIELTGSSNHPKFDNAISLLEIGNAIEIAAESISEQSALERIKTALKKDFREVADGIGW